MAKRARRVAGVDSAESMRARCRRHLDEAGYAGASLYADLAEAQGPFDWVNSCIVLQHIEPARGYGLIAQLAALTAREGALTLHITTARAPHLAAPKWRRDPLRALAHALRQRWRAPGTIMMYDYDLSRVLDLLVREGFGPFWLDPQDHGGHRGFVIFARKTG